MLPFQVKNLSQYICRGFTLFPPQPITNKDCRIESHKVLNVQWQCHRGHFPQKYFLAPPQFAPKIIANTLKFAKIWQFQHKKCFACFTCIFFFIFVPLKIFFPPFSPRGGHSNGKRGYQARPWAHTKSTLITYFSGMKIDPNYAFLHAFFLICPSCPFQNLSIWPKTHPFFQFCTFLHP